LVQDGREFASPRVEDLEELFIEQYQHGSMIK
jgi:hypothetical protein